MGFNTNPAANRNQNQGQADDSWKAEGFLNFTLTLDGRAETFPGIPLKAAKHQKLIDWLAKDPGNAQKLLKAMTVNYRSAAPQARDYDFSSLG